MDSILSKDVFIDFLNIIYFIDIVGSDCNNRVCLILPFICLCQYPQGQLHKSSYSVTTLTEFSSLL